jgi:hypothetical protein
MSEENEITDGQTIENVLPPEGEITEDSIPGENKPNVNESRYAGKPPGYDPVDPKTATPEEIQDRFNYMFRQIKDQKRTDQTLRQYKEIAAEQARQLEELTNGFTGVVNHLQDKTFNETESQLTQAMQTAFEAGDTKAYLDAQNKLLDLKADKKVAALQKKNAPKQERKTELQTQEEIELAPEDQLVVDTWQDERDETGNILRPWAHNRGTTENPDPQYLAALQETFAVLRNPNFQNATMEQKMAEVDRRMGVKKSASRQTVMGGGLTGNRKTNKLTLSPKQQEIALKTGSRDKSDAEKIDWYRKQLEKVNQRKGARA